MSEALFTKLAAVRRKHVSVSAGAGVALGVMCFVLVLAAGMFVDWWVELPYLARAAVLAAHAALLAYIAARHVVWPVVSGPDDETVALWCEGQYPESNSRLISAVQLARHAGRDEADGASPSMVARLLEETNEFVGPRDLTEVVKADRFAKLTGLAAVLALLLGVGLVWLGQPGTDLLLRAFLVPGVDVPRKTRVEWVTPEAIAVARGDSVTISARAAGIVPEAGKLRVEYDSGASREFDLPADPENAGQFKLTIENVQDSFRCRALLNDGRSREARVDAAIRPAPQSVEVWQHYPAYTGLGRVRRPAGDLTLLAGSRLEVNVIANKPVKLPTASDAPGTGNRVQLFGANSAIPFTVNPDDRTRLTAGVAGGFVLPPTTSGLSIHLRDDLGLTTKDPAVYRVELVPDKAPTVTITAGTRQDDLVTRNGNVVVGFEVADDFGLAGVKLHYEVKASAGENGASGDGLVGEYFNNERLTGEPKLRRVDRQIDFNWAGDKPDPKVRNDSFTVRWTGFVIPPFDGDWVFTADSDDGTRVWIDDKLVIDEWNNQRHVTSSQPITMTAGQPSSIRVEYQEAQGDARVQLLWQHASRARQVIPQAALFSSKEKVAEAAVLARGSVDLDIGSKPGKAVRGFYEWRIADLKPKPAEGNVIEWYLEATDNNNVTGPGKGRSERYQVRVGTEAEVRASLMNRLGDYAGQMEDVRQSQQEQADRLGQRILAKPVQNAPPAGSGGPGEGNNPPPPR